VTTHYYVYYRVDAAQEARLRAVVERMQAALRSETGIAGRLLRRRDDAQTWMEIYENVDDSTRFEVALNAAISHAGLDALLPAGRVVERFVPIEPTSGSTPETRG
jgi:hypothetical protein